MATAGHSEEHQHDEVSGMCPICFKVSGDARLLDCLHSVCRPCLEHMAVTDEGEVSCPLCRTTTRLPDGGVSSLPEDVTSEAKASDWKSCLLCDEAETASQQGAKLRFWCSECSVVVCSDHIAQHLASGNGRHSIVTFGEKAVRPPAVDTGRQHCSKHKERQKHFCVSCDECICGDCSLKGERHDGHRPIVRVEDVVSERKALVGKEADELSSDVERLERGIAAVDDVTCRLSTRADEVRAEIRRERERAVKAIDEQVCNLLQQVQDLEDSRSKQLDIQRDALRSHLQKVRIPKHAPLQGEARGETWRRTRSDAILIGSAEARR